MAGAAELVMKKSDNIPIAIIKGVKYNISDLGVHELIRDGSGRLLFINWYQVNLDLKTSELNRSPITVLTYSEKIGFASFQDIS